MTIVYNNPANFAEDQFEGFLDLYSDRLRGVPGGAVSHRTPDPIVAVVVGGGSGHYPAFCGLVGPGFASGAVVGNVFTSPSAAQVYSVAKAADQGSGVILSFGNYAGDVLNFGIAAERLCSEGIDTRMVVVTDDVASSEIEEQRRGIAGDFTVFKALGAAAAAGFTLDEVERIGRKANDSTRSFGVAFTGCTLPGAIEPLFTVPVGHLGVGLGIHGEPGIRDAKLMPATDLARLLVDGVLNDSPPDREVLGFSPNGDDASHSRRAAVIINGLGTIKYEELFLLWGSVGKRLRNAGVQPVDVEVGELVTSLNIGGVSLTLMWLDPELETMWRADAYTPGYRKSAVPLAALARVELGSVTSVQEAAPTPSAAGSELGGKLADYLAIVAETVREHENELGRIDAVAGDGDHGRGMVKGAHAALTAIRRLTERCPSEHCPSERFDGVQRNPVRSESGGDAASETLPAVGIGPRHVAVGPAWLLRQAGRAWSAEAGGTSGALWGAAIEAAGKSLTDDRSDYSPADFVAAAHAFTATITALGRAQLGDKTMVDALLPFLDSLRMDVSQGVEFGQAWRAAANQATTAALATAALSPRLGRARPLAERSIGTPDAGATSFALIVEALGQS